MVELMLILRKYGALELAGFRRARVLMTSRRLSLIFSSSKLTRANDRWMIPALSTRNSTRPALSSLTILATSKVTVPLLGLGISPRGPRIGPIRPTWPIIRSEEHTSELQSRPHLVCRLL